MLGRIFELIIGAAIIFWIIGFVMSKWGGDSDTKESSNRNGRGVPQDDVQAVKWTRLAADQGDAWAQFHLGSMYRIGLGVPQDDAQAVKWYRLAADQGYALAPFHLGEMYTFGQGVPQDYVQAHKWYNLAAAEGDVNGNKNRDTVAQLMTPQQIAQAQELARNWKPKQ